MASFRYPSLSPWIDQRTVAHPAAHLNAPLMTELLVFLALFRPNAGKLVRSNQANLIDIPDLIPLTTLPHRHTMGQSLLSPARRRRIRSSIEYGRVETVTDG